MTLAVSANPIDAFSTAERQLIARLARLDEGHSLILDAEADIRLAHGLRGAGIVQGQNDEDEGFRLTTIGRAVAEGVA